MCDRKSGTRYRKSNIPLPNTTKELLTPLKDLSDASVVSLQLHLELGQFLVQFTQVSVHLRHRGSMRSTTKTNFKPIKQLFCDT